MPPRVDMSTVELQRLSLKLGQKLGAAVPAKTPPSMVINVLMNLLCGTILKASSKPGDARTLLRKVVATLQDAEAKLEGELEAQAARAGQARAH